MKVTADGKCEFYRELKGHEQCWRIAVNQKSALYVRRSCECSGDPRRCDFKKACGK